MKVAQYASPGQIKLIEMPIPQIESDEVLVRLDKVAICGSDLHVVYEMPPDKYPFPPGFSGHECVGVVEESDSPDFNPDDWVLMIPPEANAWAEYVTVGSPWLIPIPDHLLAEQAVLAQLLGCIIYTCKKLKNVLGKTAVVIGQGPAGLLFSAMLHRMGVRQVIGLDVIEHRLETAICMGADHVINVDDVSPVEVVTELTQGQMADVVIEAVGKEETINLCADLARPFGELALFGGPMRKQMMLDFEKFLRKQLYTTTTIHTQQEPGLASFRLAMEFIANNRIDVTPLISHHIPFEDIRQAFALAYYKQDGAIKVLVDFKP